jgi:hypothetical protein
MGMGSDISNIVRLWTVDEETPNETLRRRLPPRSTKPSAMIPVSLPEHVNGRAEGSACIHERLVHQLLTTDWNLSKVVGSNVK